MVPRVSGLIGLHVQLCEGWWEDRLVAKNGPVPLVHPSWRMWRRLPDYQVLRSRAGGLLIMNRRTADALAARVARRVPAEVRAVDNPLFAGLQ